MYHSSQLSVLVTIAVEILANPIQLPGTTDISQSSTDLDADAPLTDRMVKCFQPGPSSTVPSIYLPDCFLLLNDILISPNVGASRTWSATFSGYPRSNHACSISLEHDPALPDPQERFREYVVAIAVAFVISTCQENHGGFAFVTGSKHFIARLDNPQGPSLNGQASIIAVPPTTNATGSEPSLATHLGLPSNLTSIATSPITDLNAIFTCSVEQSGGVYAVPIIKEDCYALFQQMLLIIDITKPKTWSGVNPGGSWVHGGCAVSLHGYGLSSVDYIKPIELLLSAAQVVQLCVVERGLAFGGMITVGG